MFSSEAEWISRSEVHTVLTSQLHLVRMWHRAIQSGHLRLLESVRLTKYSQTVSFPRCRKSTGHLVHNKSHRKGLYGFLTLSLLREKPLHLTWMLFFKHIKLKSSGFLFTMIPNVTETMTGQTHTHTSVSPWPLATENTNNYRNVRTLGSVQNSGDFCFLRRAWIMYINIKHHLVPFPQGRLTMNLHSALFVLVMDPATLVPVHLLMLSSSSCSLSFNLALKKGLQHSLMLLDVPKVSYLSCFYYFQHCSFHFYLVQHLFAFI